MTALTLGGGRDNLPAEVTRFIGRRRELPAITDAVARHRLVTLHGTGGVGKTRLALRAAGALRESFRDGCWLVELSALHDPGLLPRAVSGALGLPGESSGDALAGLAANLADREFLMVLDTCEHLLEACADLARTLLQAAPGLRILVTSREPLRLEDEHTLAVTPLELPASPGSLPDPGRAGGSSAASVEFDAIALFLDRAQAAMPEFALRPENMAAAVELCRRLDGIPLALELAAVRLRSMAVDEMLRRLDDRFRILGTARTTVDRHRTLSAAVQWSYGLCTPDEQALWSRLSVFPGGFDLMAAEYLCGRNVRPTLNRLVEKSIVAGDERSGRYRMLDTMREFGAEQLSATAADELRARHRDYYLGLAEQAATQTLSPDQVSWMTRLRDETDNLRVALDWSLRAAGQGGAGLRMTVLLRTYWLMTGMFTEGRTWHERVMAVGPGTRDNAWAVYGTGILAVQQGDLAQGAPLLERAAGLATALSDKDLATHVTEAQGMVAFYAGDLETAFARHTEALAVYEESGFSDAVALSGYARLASVCLLNLDIARAAELCEVYLRRCDEAGEQWGRGTALWTRGAARWLSGENEAGVTDALEALRIKEQLGDLHTMTMCFDLLAVCAAALSQFERAAVLYGVGDTFWKVLNAPMRMGPGYSDIRRNAGETALASLGQERYETAYRYGLALSLAEAIVIARGKQPDLPARIQAAKPLTRREKEIGRLVAAGLGNREIAERLYLSKRTVDSHLEHIFAKLGFSSRTQLANWILEHPDL